ncbi:MAG: P27 family phage terminase small subunit [Actinobacteria bacterium]|nr:P27 family phage terminase small subunit [Actinomycetota bacterium]
MGQRGPAPTPTALKLVKGVKGDRVNRSEPIPSDGTIRPPKDLSPAALAIWRYHQDDLVKAGLLTTWDIGHLAVYCDARARHIEAKRHLDVECEVVKGALGGPIPNPWFGIWKTTSDVMNRYGAKFGLSPSDRSQIKVGDGTAKQKGADRLMS